MNAQPTDDDSRENPLLRNAPEGLQGALRIAVQRIRGVPRPADLGAQLIQRAAQWQRESPLLVRRRAPWRLSVALASVAVAAALVAFWIGRQLGPHPSAPVPVAAQPDQEVALDTREVAADRAALAGGQQEKSVASRTVAQKSGLTPRIERAQKRGASRTADGAAGEIVAPGRPEELPTVGPQAGVYAQYVSVPDVVVASSAPVFVIACGDGPQKLGAHGSYKWSDHSIQVWNWTEGDTSRQLEGSVSGAMAVSPDGKWIVTGGGRKIDAATGKADPNPFADFPHGDGRAVSFSPDGRRLAVSVNMGNHLATVYVIDFPSGRKRCEIPGQWGYALRPQVAAFTADGSQLVLMDKDKFIRRWDAETGKGLLKYEPARSNSIAAIAVSPDGKLLASADGEGHNYLWELQSGRLLRRLVARQDPDHDSLRRVFSFAFSPDGKRLAGGGLQNLVVWSTSSGQIEHVFPRSSAGTAHIRFSEDGNRLTTVHEAHFARLKADDKEEVFVWPTVREWVLDRERGVTERRGIAGAVPCPDMAVAADAPVLVSTGGDEPLKLGARSPYDPRCRIHVWDWSKSPQSRPLPVFHNGRMAVSPDGKWIVTGDGRKIDASSGKVEPMENFFRHIDGMAFSPDGRTLLLLGVEEAAPRPDPNRVGTARVLDFPSAKKRFEIPGQSPHIFACTFRADSSQFFLMGKDRFVRRWDAKTGKELGRYEPAFTNSISAIAVSPRADRVAAASSNGDTYLWEFASGRLLGKLTANFRYSPRVRSLTFSPDGKLLVGGASGTLVLWETDSGRVVQELPWESGAAVHLRFSKDGRNLATVHEFYGSAYPTVQEWEVEAIGR